MGLVRINFMLDDLEVEFMMIRIIRYNRLESIFKGLIVEVVFVLRAVIRDSKIFEIKNSAK